jgi:predicted nucleic acid-binding protein
VAILVPDSSVLLKWVLESKDEQDRDAALKLREYWLSGRCSIILPPLWFFEVGNIVGMKQPALAPALMEMLIEYAFEEASAADTYRKAFELMTAFKVTFYDASYHAVAIRYSGSMITSDEAYYRKTSEAGHVDTLANWAQSSELL